MAEAGVMSDDREPRRRRNAKRWLWVIVAACIALAALIAYTSLETPEPYAPTGDMPVTAQQAQ